MHCRWNPSMPCSRSPGGLCSWEGGACSQGRWPSVMALSCGLLLCPSVMAFWFGGLLIEGGLLVWPSGGGGRWPSHQKATTQECLVETPLPPDGYCCGRYASYWNAFLFKQNFKTAKRTNQHSASSSSSTSSSNIRRRISAIHRRLSPGQRQVRQHTGTRI